MLQVWVLWSLILRVAELRPRGSAHSVDKGVVSYVALLLPASSLGIATLYSTGCLMMLEPEVGGLVGSRPWYADWSHLPDVVAGPAQLCSAAGKRTHLASEAIVRS